MSLSKTGYKLYMTMYTTSQWNTQWNILPILIVLIVSLTIFHSLLVPGLWIMHYARGTIDEAPLSTFHSITPDGNFDEWTPDEMLGFREGYKFYFTFDEDYLYFGFDRRDTNNDMFIALDTRSGGSTISTDWNGIHNYSVNMDFIIAIEDESYSYIRAWNGSAWKDIYDLNSDSNSYLIGEDIELRVSRVVIGNPTSLNMLAYGQWENLNNVFVSWPTKNPARNLGSEYFSFIYNYSSLSAGIKPSEDQIGNLPTMLITPDGYNSEWTPSLSNFKKITDSSEDSGLNVKNLVDNELLNFYYAWDDNYLYLSYDFITGYYGDINQYDAGVMVLIDGSTIENDGTQNFSNLNVWQRKVALQDFNAEFFFAKWDDMKGNFYHIYNSTYAEDITYNISRGETGGAKINGAVELAVPWNVIYGSNYQDILPTARLKFILILVGSDGTNAQDSIPDNQGIGGSSLTEFVTLNYYVSIDKIDSEPPTISGITISDLTENNVTVSWETSEPTTGEFMYGTNSTNLSFNVSNHGYTSTHRFNLTGLLKATKYYYKIISIDRANNSRSFPLLSTDIEKATFITAGTSQNEIIKPPSENKTVQIDYGKYITPVIGTIISLFLLGVLIVKIKRVYENRSKSESIYMRKLTDREVEDYKKSS